MCPHSKRTLTPPRAERSLNDRHGWRLAGGDRWDGWGTRRTSPQTMPTIVGVTIESSIPAVHPRWAELEGHLSTVLSEAAGDWYVEVHPAQTVPWWVIQIRCSTDGFQRTLLLNPDEETSEAIAAGLRDSVAGRLI